MSEVPAISRKPLHERSDSQSNSNNSSQNNLANKLASGPPARETSSAYSTHTNTSANTIPRAAIRLVPSTPPQLLGTVTGRDEPAGPSIASFNEARDQDREQLTSLGDVGSLRDEVYSRTPLPTHPLHILTAPGKGKDPAYTTEFRTNLQAQLHHKSSGSSLSPGLATHWTPQNVDSDTPAPISKVKPPAKKRLHIHKDNKTFSLLQDDQDVQSTDALQSPILSLSRASSYDSLASQARYAQGRSNSTESCLQSAPATPSPDAKKPISVDPITTTSSPWNYQLVGGLRKVPKTPDLKQRELSESPLPPVPEASDRPSGASHDLSTKLSFQSTQTTTSSTTSLSESSNYKIYDNTFASTSDVALPAATSDTNYQLIGTPSIAPSEAPSEPSSNYQLIGPPLQLHHLSFTDHTQQDQRRSPRQKKTRITTYTAIRRQRGRQSILLRHQIKSTLKSR
jgi:hypothetical protein